MEKIINRNEKQKLIKKHDKIKKKLDKDIKRKKTKTR